MSFSLPVLHVAPLRAFLRQTWKLNATKRSLATAAATVNASQSLGPTHQQLVDSAETRRLSKIRQAKPFSDFLTDTFHRQHDYLRISLTERCNLRCLYCMPEDGVRLSPNKNLLTTDEILHLATLFVKQGVRKIRLTGGEPTVRKDLLPLMSALGKLRQHGLRDLAITTNGLTLHRHLETMVEAGLTAVNISLDTLDPLHFELLTRRRGFDAVMKSIDKVKDLNRSEAANIKLKINCVVMRDLNQDQILPFVEMTRHEDLEVRFIEYMPFDGNRWSKERMMSYADIWDIIATEFPTFQRLHDATGETSKTWQVPGFVGKVGFITSMTHNFCGSCNRLRITADGNLKVCLHGQSEVSLRDMLREASGGEPLFGNVEDVLEKTESRSSPEMDCSSRERRLLEVIGAAVKRKEKGHAGMDVLKHMQNRPMILIGG